jgi:hypothetical protein
MHEGRFEKRFDLGIERGDGEHVQGVLLEQVKSDE